MTANEYRANCAQLASMKSIIRFTGHEYPFIWVGFTMAELAPRVTLTDAYNAIISDARMNPTEANVVGAVRLAVQNWLAAGDQPLPDLEQIAKAAYEGAA